MDGLDAVIVAVGARSVGVALSAVREVVRCGPITPVPSAPPAIVGAVNARGQVVPVLDLGLLLGEQPAQARIGDAGLRICVGEVDAVVVAGRVVEVVALHEAEPPAPATPAALTRPMSSAGGPVELVELEALVEELRRQVAAAARAASAGVASGGEPVVVAGAAEPEGEGA